MRNLVRSRIYFVQRRTSCKNRIHKVLLRRGIEVPGKKPFTKTGLDFLKNCEYEGRGLAIDMLETINFLNIKICGLDDEIRRVGSSIREVRLWRTIHGVDWFTALTVYAEMGDIRRFRSRKQFAGFTGLVPRVHQSGEKDYKGHITKSGPPVLRWTLIQAAHVCVKHDNRISRLCFDLKEKKGSKKAMVAAARNLAVVMYRMAKKNEPFRAS